MKLLIIYPYILPFYRESFIVWYIFVRSRKQQISGGRVYWFFYSKYNITLSTKTKEWASSNGFQLACSIIYFLRCFDLDSNKTSKEKCQININNDFQIQKKVQPTPLRDLAHDSFLKPAEKHRNLLPRHTLWS